MGALASEPVLASRRPAMLYLYAARAARGVGDGFAFIILPAYLSELGFNPLQIGVVATVALLGSAATTLAVGFLAARYDLRNLLLIGAMVMAATGLAVAHSQALALILVIVFLGSLNPSTGDIGMIVPLEHAMLARGAQDEERTKVFARYSLIGTASTAAGALAAATPDFLVSFGASRLDALTAMFYLYAALGAVGVLLYRRLPPVSSCRPFSRYGCSSASTCRSRPPACSFSGPTCSARCPIRSRRGSLAASGSSTPWCSPTFPRASAWCSPRSRRACRSCSLCCSCVRRSPRWTCRPALPT